MNKFLIDTYTLLWYRAADERIGKRVIEIFSNPDAIKIISIATFWELAIKQSLGKLSLEEDLNNLYNDVVYSGFEISPIEMEQINVLQTLPYHHKDPFDRILIATAIAQNIPIISKDQHFSKYSIQTIWE